MKTSNTLIFTLFIALVLVAAGCSTHVDNGTGNVPAQTAAGQNTPPPAPPPTVKTVEMNDSAKNATQQHQDTVKLLVADGTYTNDVTYEYHSGTELITISVTLKDDVVTAASITPHNPNRVSAHYIAGVNAALPDLVIGKRIDQIAIPRQVSGSSLTSAALAQYLQGLMQQQ